MVTVPDRAQNQPAAPVALRAPVSGTGRWADETLRNACTDS